MYLRNLEIRVLKYINLILQNFSQLLVSMASSFKKTKVNLDLLTDIEMLLIAEKNIRGGIFHPIYQ